MFMTIDGRVVDDPSAHTWVLDPAGLRRQGLFETLRIYSGRAFEVRAHIDRMRRAAEKLDMRMPPDVADLVQIEAARAEAAGLRDAYARITLSIDPVSGVPVLVTMIDSLPAFEPRWYSSGMRIATAPIRRDEFAVTAAMKTTASLAEILAFRQSGSLVDDEIFLDSEGHFSEASASNIFFVDDGTLVTPPESCGALPGITRRIICEIARSAGMPVVADRAVSPDILASASEMFLTSSVREIVPVVAVDETSIGNGLPGPVFSQMRGEYSRLTQ